LRIYLDLCCLNRPFDDQTQRRVVLEAQAVNLILENLLGRRDHRLCGSTALWVENSQNPRAERRNRIEEILKQATLWIPYRESLDKRVLYLRRLGFREFDAYHFASAESGACDRLVTCDDQFLKVGQRNAARIKVLVTDPISLVSEAGF
jgi:predicted nucleic acid-binding protein